MKTNTTVISALGIISEFAIVKLIFFCLFVLFFKFANQCPSLQMCPYSKTGTQAVKKRPGELLFSVWGGASPDFGSANWRRCSWSNCHASLHTFWAASQTHGNKKQMSVYVTFKDSCGSKISESSGTITDAVYKLSSKVIGKLFPVWRKGTIFRGAWVQSSFSNCVLTHAHTHTGFLEFLQPGWLYLWKCPQKASLVFVDPNMMRISDHVSKVPIEAIMLGFGGVL